MKIDEIILFGFSEYQIGILSVIASCFEMILIELKSFWARKGFGHLLLMILILFGTENL